jgi:predicted ATPase
MRIESLRLKNFKAFRNAEIKKIPPFCVFIGANGSGKSTVFSVFGFLQEALSSNVNVALQKFGGNRGFSEVRSRNADGPIEIELKYRIQPGKPLITYTLRIDEHNGRAFVASEILQYRRLERGRPWRFLDFANGTGTAVTNEMDDTTNDTDLKREEQNLRSPDILAVKGLAQFKRFPAVMALGDLIDNWHVSDFHISQARPEPAVQYAEHLSSEGDNLANVVQYLYNNHRPVFDGILRKMTERVPGINRIDAKTTEEGRVLLRFQDGSFSDPFLARYVSDGTIKMLAYLVLLNDPNPHPLLCVEEPENQLHPRLLSEIAEEFREYATRGGQVFVSTHSPDFLNAVQLDEVFYLYKKRGCTNIHRAADDEQIRAYMSDGDRMGNLWNQGLFPGADPAV